MHTHIGTTPYDTTRSCNIVDEINELEHVERNIRRILDGQTQALIMQYTKELLAQKPEYPTAQQQQLLVEIAERIHDDSSDTPISSGPVTFYPLHGLINVYAQAPYHPRGMTRLWELSESSITQVKTLLRQQGLSIIDDWIHEDGHGFRVRSKRV